MGQNGNETHDWYNKLTKKEVSEIKSHVNSLDVDYWEDCLQNRGCQVSFSFTGHSAPIKIKKKFDPDKKFRNLVLKTRPFKSKTLMVKVAGTTCLDYNRKGNSKGDNLKRYMKLHKLKKQDCIYYGDNFSRGGNDESVLKVMRCVNVTGPADLYEKLC
jgi:hydroxymethylpyrimidine pyrophosphatase-like HAD family hydrolase